ncbi:hypothetical protein Cgig2_014408 [Carnegiea gigantea]|uniref:Uncharacterized protein n=1 Tax=Carnegiea gigantea TaxID=171969 RepID=A0A9Q1GL88_9CARY|nr:hypothetical protein Cgig2_014408 [Carnegiea gigantea]
MSKVRHSVDFQHQKHTVKEVGFDGFLLFEADTIPGKLVVCLVHNFDSCSRSVPLAYGSMRVTNEDVYMTLCLLKGPLDVMEPKIDVSVGDDCNDGELSGWRRGLQMKFHKVHRVHMAEYEFEVGFGKALFQDDKVATDKIVTNNRLTAKSKKGSCESRSDAIIRDVPKKSKSRIPILSLDFYKSEGFLMEMDANEKRFFTPPSFSHGFSQEGNRALPSRVVLVDSKPDILTTEVQVLNRDMQDVLI